MIQKELLKAGVYLSTSEGKLNIFGNPLEEKHSADGDWLDRVTKSLKALRKLDGNPIIKNEEEDDD